jgi:hypothetical protein
VCALGCAFPVPREGERYRELVIGGWEFRTADGRVTRRIVPLLQLRGDGLPGTTLGWSDLAVVHASKSGGVHEEGEPRFGVFVHQQPSSELQFVHQRRVGLNVGFGGLERGFSIGISSTGAIRLPLSGSRLVRLLYRSRDLAHSHLEFKED